MTAPMAGPGWYPDPEMPALRWRWWDGSQWSGYIQQRPTAPGPGAWQPAGPPPAGPPAGARTAHPTATPVIPARAAWWALLGLLAGEVFGLILAGVAYAVTGSSTGAPTTLTGEIGLWGGMLGAVLFVSRRYGAGTLREDFHLSFKPRDLGYGCLAALVGLIVSVTVGSTFQHTRFSGSNTQIVSGQKGNTTGVAIVTIIVAVGAPLFEELFFRGLIRTALQSKLGGVGAVWAQAALFGLAHYQPGNGLGNISVMVAIFGLGLVLGYTAYLTQRLAAGMIAHGLFNTIVSIVVLAG